MSNFLTSFENFLTGNTVTTSTTPGSTTTPVISPTTIIIVDVIGIVAIVLLRKYKVPVIAIAIILVFFTIYGFLAKTTIVTQGTTNTDTTGGFGKILTAITFGLL